MIAAPDVTDAAPAAEAVKEKAVEEEKEEWNKDMVASPQVYGLFTGLTSPQGLVCSIR